MDEDFFGDKGNCFSDYSYRFVCSVGFGSNSYLQKVYEVQTLRNYLRAMLFFECERSGILIGVDLKNRTLIEQCESLKDNIIAVRRRQVYFILYSLSPLGFSP